MEDKQLPVFPPWKQARGPWPGCGRGPGRPWRGIVEDTPTIWITWFVALAKRAGIYLEGLHIEVAGIALKIVSVELTFGQRYYFLCPECSCRREALYILRERVACRKCHHLGYRSQCHVSGSPWALWERLLNRKAWFPRRWQIPPTIAEAFDEMIRHTAQKTAEKVIERVRIWEVE